MRRTRPRIVGTGPGRARPATRRSTSRRAWTNRNRPGTGSARTRQHPATPGCPGRGGGALPASSGSAVNRSMRYRSSLVSLPSAFEESDVSHLPARGVLSALKTQQRPATITGDRGVCVRAGKRPRRRAARPVCAPSPIWGPGDCRTIGTHVCARPKRRGRTGTPPPEGERGHCQATPRAAARRATTAAIHRTHPGAAPRQQHWRDHHRGRPENRPRPGPQTPDRHRARLRDHPGGDPVSHDGDVRVVRRTTTQPSAASKDNGRRPPPFASPAQSGHELHLAGC